MPFAEHFMISGLTTAAQTAVLPASININCGFLPTKVEITNVTRYGTVTTPQNIWKMYWDSTFPSTTFLEYNATTTASISGGRVTANGISVYDGTQSILLGPTISGTSISSANPGVVTTTAPHGLQIGDVVMITGLTSMQPLGGIYFVITAVGSATTFTIPIDTSGYIAEGAGFVVRKIVVGPLFYPRDVTITAITQANPMVISTAENHNLTVGQKIRIRVPNAYGMTQANNLQGVITAVTARTITLGSIDSSAFTAFAYPPGGALWVASSPAQIVPIGSGPSQVLTPPFWYDDKLDDAETNIQFQGFTIGTGLLLTSTNAVVGVTASDVFEWTAWRGDV